jgi:thiol-disulfide isomerase/thioredoxin
MADYDELCTDLLNYESMSKETSDKSWWQRYRSDILFVVVLIVLYFSGGLKWLQVQALGLIAGSPKVQEQGIATLNETDWGWTFKSLDGELVSLSDFEGKPIFLNEWATWCGPCVAEMPSIEALYQDYGDEMAFILASSESAAKVKGFIDNKGYEAPVYTMIQNAPSEKFRSNSIPTSYLINSEGEIIVKKIGAANWNSKKLRDLLDEGI